MEPIASYALLSDSQGSALVSRTGSIDWCCTPRFDSCSIFGRLLDPDAGHWSIRPTGDYEVERSYLAETLVLRTVFHTAVGSIAITDAMPFGAGDREHSIGRSSPHAIVRVVEGLTGNVDVDIDVSLRPEYGLTLPTVVAHPGGWRAVGGPWNYVVTGPADLEAHQGTLRGNITIAAGERVRLALRAHSAWTPAPHAWTIDDVDAALEDTIAGWRSWSRLHQSYRGPYAEAVAHSGRVLQALTYAPTGAIVAAPTTSLPEQLGGQRNWDYRYAWVRDASLTLEALWVAACPDEAAEFFEFFATATGGRADGSRPLQILYAVGGERHVPEHELSHLAGYAGSRPVRIGNGAWDQLQLDVHGELLAAACQLSEQIGVFNPHTAAFLCAAADEAATRWREPDRGIWEIRTAPRDFVHSKLMCWVALDRAVRLAPLLDAHARVDHWTAERDAVRAAILEHGWNERVGSFTQSFGSETLDASTLMIAITGFLPPDDARVRATIEAVAGELTDDDGFVFRYRTDDVASDGLAGDEGTFLICSFWLVQCLAMIGDLERARALFDQLMSRANDVGLFSEELDPHTGDLLGNFPQAFTHVGLINAAYALSLASAQSSNPPDDDGARVPGRSVRGASSRTETSRS